jgi:hypothetical protein
MKWLVSQPQGYGKRFIVRADNPDCLSGTAKGDTRVRGGFDRVNHVVIAVWSEKQP